MDFEPKPDEYRFECRTLFLPPGLYALSAPAFVATDEEAAPLIQVSSPPLSDYDPVEILTAPATGAVDWIGAQGGVTVLRSPIGGGFAYVVAFCAAGVAALDRLDLQRLDRRAAPPPARIVTTSEVSPAAEKFDAPAPVSERAPVAIQVTLRVLGGGDVERAGDAWCGEIGRGRNVEGLRVKLGGALADADIEYKAFGPGGAETRWSTGGRYCGSRGRDLALTGFAMRLRNAAADRFALLYQGSFADSGPGDLRADGEPARGRAPGERLEAVRIQIMEKSGTDRESPSAFQRANDVADG